MWGRNMPLSHVNFEWPTQDMLDQWEPDVAIKSIELKNAGSLFISAVQVNLTNGQSSPVFSNTLYMHENPRTMNFDQNNKPVRRVAGGDCETQVSQVVFYDAAGDVIDSYWHNVCGESLIVHDLGEDEHLIGVYGIKDDNF